jgi:hypothetical protein
MESRLNPHLPIITPRIEFSSSSQSHPPVTITPRIDFAQLWTGDNPGSHAVSDAPSDDSDSDSNAMDFESEASDDNMSLMPLNNNEKIPKPPGEPGRPNSGGYNIKNELRVWGADKISQVMVGP